LSLFSTGSEMSMLGGVSFHAKMHFLAFPRCGGTPRIGAWHSRTRP
jgi:hypothetical protein